MLPEFRCISQRKLAADYETRVPTVEVKELVERLPVSVRTLEDYDLAVVERSAGRFFDIIAASQEYRTPKDTVFVDFRHCPEEGEPYPLETLAGYPESAKVIYIDAFYRQGVYAGYVEEHLKAPLTVLTLVAEVGPENPPGRTVHALIEVRQNGHQPKVQLPSFNTVQVDAEKIIRPGDLAGMERPIRKILEEYGDVDVYNPRAIAAREKQEQHFDGLIIASPDQDVSSSIAVATLGLFQP